MIPSSRMSCRLVFARSLLFVAALGLALTTVRAASVTWTAVPGTASWTNNANWSGGVAPSPFDSVFLTNRGASYTVNFDTASPVVITNLTMVGGGANTATLNINSGLLMITGALASSFSSNYVLNINSGGTFVYQAPNTTIAGGNINLNGGAWTNLMPAMIMGPTAGRVLAMNVVSGYLSSGAIRVDGAGVVTLRVSGGFAEVGGVTVGVSTAGRETNNTFAMDGGILRSGATGMAAPAGTMQFSGGIISNTSSMSIGSLLNSTGRFVQTGGFLDEAAQIRVGSSSNGWGFFMLGGGTVSNHNTLQVGDQNSAIGKLTITNGTWWQEGVATVGGRSTSTYTNSLGELLMSGGSFTATNDVVVAYGVNAKGTVTMAGGNFTVTNAARTGVLEIGRLGLGTLNLSNGTLLVDRLLATNGASSVVNFAGGTLQSRSTTVSNGTLFTVGDGLSAASLSLNGGSHRFANNLLLSSNATLAGTGTVVAASLTSHGTIAPGFSPGTLTVTGDVSLASDSILSMELAGTNSGAFDVLNVVGNLSLGGLLKVSLLTYAPQESDAFQLFNGTLSGAFLGYDLPTLGAGLNWDTSQLGVNGTLLVFAVPEPGSALLLGAALLATGAWRFRRQRS